jgi:hypothetical protein
MGKAGMEKAPAADDTLRDTPFAAVLGQEVIRIAIFDWSPRRGPCRRFSDCSKRLHGGRQDRRVHAAELFRIEIVA